MANVSHSRRFSRLLNLNSEDEGVEKNYDIMEEIGRGKFAIVKRCRSRLNDQEFAGKFIRKRKNRKGGSEVQKEIEVLQKLSHDHIVKLYEHYESPIEIVLILELVTGGELFHYLVERDRVTEEESTWFVRQMLEALKYMHQLQVVHLDLKPENIVLCSRKERKVKLIDFGLSIILQDGVVVREITGTPEFVAPEIINFDPVTCAADMWSIGVMTYIMLSGCSPFLGDDDHETLANVSRGEYSFDEEYFSNSSHLSKDFINKLLNKNPKSRATANECLNHSWIKTKDEEDEECKRKSTLNITLLKSFIAKRRWRQSFHAVSFSNHMHKVALNKKENKVVPITRTSLDLSSDSRNRAKERMSVIQDYDSE